MAEWMFWLFVGLAVVFAAVGVLRLLVIYPTILPKGMNTEVVILVLVLAASAALIGAVGTSNVLGESDDLMGRLGWEPRGFIVTSVDSEEVCAVLTGDDDVTCMERQRVFNDGEERFGAQAVTLIPGECFSATKLKVFGEEGVLLHISR